MFTSALDLVLARVYRKWCTSREWRLNHVPPCRHAHWAICRSLSVTVRHFCFHGCFRFQGGFIHTRNVRQSFYLQVWFWTCYFILVPEKLITVKKDIWDGLHEAEARFGESLWIIYSCWTGTWDSGRRFTSKWNFDVRQEKASGENVIWWLCTFLDCTVTCLYTDQQLADRPDQIN